jgi:tetratricopeptide (TPR) repeat protein
MTRHVAPLALIALLLCSTPALAQQASSAQQAEDHYQSAAKLFGEGRYREALEEFDAAIAIAPEAIFFCNRAVVLIKLQEFDAALDSMRTCRDTFEGDPRELAQIDAQLNALTLYVRHLQRNAAATATTIATRPKSAPGTPPPKPGWGASDTGYLVLGVGAALLGSAATLDLLSADLVQDYRDAATGPDPARYAQLKQDLSQRQRVFWGLTIGGSILAATGASIVLYNFISEDDTPQPISHAMILPTISPDGTGVIFDLRF